MGLLNKFVGKGINALVEEARQDPNAVILDVRTKQEYEMGHIEGAINVPITQIERVVTKFPDKTLYIHCASGARSRLAVKQLKSAGLANVHDIGGISSWRGPLVTE